ncbi:zinc-ribbon domain-containing protein [Sphingomonas sp. LY160]|uniref:zinc-ribbon domain-containing protein n=1 Tax=Sphingomonas sp. LY160 TaxID=3095342 RepID=UPI002ADEAD52|nr:zinc-ribbon domain-containing protein [Sphingomonas sp. LY160]MEA1072388.1 zinc-ribbon domain-containing protein [Sphingomonas sp. LY160]
MILTCPACGTKYVVKDGAVPPGGRQVRCAACKNSWHQDPEPVAAIDPAPPVDVPVAEDIGGGPPVPEAVDEPNTDTTGEVPAEAEAHGMIAETPEPYDRWSDPVPPEPATDPVEADPAPPARDALPFAPPAHEREPAPPPAPAAEEEYIGYVDPYEDEERPRRRWPWAILLVFLIALAAVAFWYLAPTEWKARAGIAQAGTSPLLLMITTKDRQQLESGNELVVISGRVINPTDQSQNVPPIQAELRNKESKAVIHRWTIAPPTQQLAPRASANFNSAKTDVPEGGDELTISLGNAPATGV